MKKILAILLAGLMLLSLASCGSNQYEAAAKDLTEITGQKTTAEDVQEAIKDIELRHWCDDEFINDISIEIIHE